MTNQINNRKGNEMENETPNKEESKMENGSMNPSNDTESAEVLGTVTNPIHEERDMETPSQDKKALTPYQKLIRRSYGIKTIEKASILQKLRNDVQKLQSDFSNQVEKMNVSTDGIDDDLDRLAHKDQINVITEQISSLKKVLETIANRVKKLL